MRLMIKTSMCGLIAYSTIPVTATYNDTYHVSRAVGTERERERGEERQRDLPNRMCAIPSQDPSCGVRPLQLTAHSHAPPPLPLPCFPLASRALFFFMGPGRTGQWSVVVAQGSHPKSLKLSLPPSRSVPIHPI